MKHTRGPWSAEPCRFIEGVWIVRSNTGSSAGELVLHVFPIKGLASGDNAEADAKLIAASPALLANLKYAIWCLENPGCGPTPDALANMNAAVALAEPEVRK